MRQAHPIERRVGIEYYVSDADPIGGRLRDRPEDFQVEEIEAFDIQPIDADPGAYPDVVCRVTLREWDTNDFASRLSDQLGISRERVSWAGTKDKHAITTQLFSVRDVDPERLDTIDISGAAKQILGRAGRPISFGDLAGNAFEIVVRDADRPGLVDTVSRDLRSFADLDDGERTQETTDADNGANATLQDSDPTVEDNAFDAEIGVPNVFGQQRFGSRRPVTHEVGLAIVRKNWREAVRLYAGNPAETEPESTIEARSFVDAQFESTQPDWQECLDRMPRRLGFERSMLHRLADAAAREPTSTTPEASIPEDGGVWRDALEAVPTNLQRLFVNAAQSALFNRMLSERLERQLPFSRPVAGDVCCFADADVPDGFAKPDPDRLQRVDEDRVSIVTRHCNRGRAFVTAPLVGTETELADGAPGDIERSVLEEAGIAPSDFALPGEFDSAGTRRAILVRTTIRVDREPLTLSFSLPSGSYATAVLREYLKVDPTSL